MRALALLLVMIASPASPQTSSIDCNEIVQKLKAKPPGDGDAHYVQVLWNLFIHECEAKMGGPGATFDSEEMIEISKVLNPVAFK